MPYEAAFMQNTGCISRPEHRTVYSMRPHKAATEAHPSVCRRQGLSEYPVTDIYKGRRRCADGTAR